MSALKWITLALVAVFIVASGVFAAGWYVSPGFQEKILLVGISPLSPDPLQEMALKKLRQIPTQVTAISLIAYINFKHQNRISRQAIKYQAEEAEEELTEAEIEARYQNAVQKRKERIKLAGDGLKTLCILSGHDFGSRYEKLRNSYSFSRPSDSDWPRILGRINGWALQTFGGDLLQSLGDAIPNEMPGEMEIETQVNPPEAIEI